MTIIVFDFRCFSDSEIICHGILSFIRYYFDGATFRCSSWPFGQKRKEEIVLIKTGEMSSRMAIQVLSFDCHPQRKRRRKRRRRTWRQFIRLLKEIHSRKYRLSYFLFSGHECWRIIISQCQTV